MQKRSVPCCEAAATLPRAISCSDGALLLHRVNHGDVVARLAEQDGNKPDNAAREAVGKRVDVFRSHWPVPSQQEWNIFSSCNTLYEGGGHAEVSVMVAVSLTKTIAIGEASRAGH